MSLYSHSFNFMASPNGYGGVRPQLPDFQNVGEMKEFVSRLFLFHLQIPHIFLQVKFGASLFVVILFNGLLIIIRRMYDKSFWVARLVKRPSGTIIVPNAILSFAMVESIFITVLVALLFQFCQYYEYYKVKPANFILWITLPWCTAILGVYWAMLGSHYATPTRVKPIGGLYNDRLNWVERLFQNAFMVNFIAAGLPAILCTSVAIPSFMANAHYNKAQKMEEDWQGMYANQTVFTQEMVTEAQLIWYKVLQGTRTASVVFYLWFVWAVVCWLLYTSITFRLIMTIRSELNRPADDVMTFIVTTAHQYSPKMKGIMSQGQSETQLCRRITFEEPPRLSYNGSKGDLSLKQKLRSLPIFASPIVAHSSLSLTHIDEAEPPSPILNRTREPPSPILHRTSEPPSPILNRAREPPSPILNRASETPSPILNRANELPPPSPIVNRFNGLSSPTLNRFNGLPSPTLNRAEMNQSQQRSKEAIDQPQIKTKLSAKFLKSFLPNLILEDDEESSSRLTTNFTQESRKQQKKEMRKAFLQIFVQFLVVSPGCATFASIALFMALTINSSFEKPSSDGLGNRFEYFGPVALLCVVYAIIVFGCGASFALLQRTYEPVFTAITTSHNSHGILRSSQDEDYSLTCNSKVCQTVQNVDPRIGIGQSPIPREKDRRSRAPKKIKTNHIISTFFETKSHHSPRQEDDGDRI
ncbi:uncharacterized protein FA14DRAFT_93027 [Meira miltonrushii]|uniref:Uncharacterized protein n=1 Tax=Meira miltonrushii TaxID=1280837 RepID=A0A316V2P2_9BASI|nr:uncharacterized protein FA14DRAFT_93027 [Meira miltonrushii]PWN31790.1 hypothetical protein FA14DRAFT_93027 [Meira miltonrushii]